MSKNRPTIQDKSNSTEKTINEDTFDFSDQLAVPPAILREIEEQGLYHRWINAKKLAENFGFDKRQLVPFKSKTASTGQFSGVDSEGYVRRGDLILAVQPKAIAAKRKAVIDQRNARNKLYNKEAAAAIKDQFNKSGIKGKVSEGFDEND